MNGCAPRLALRMRLKVIRKWPIQLSSLSIKVQLKSQVFSICVQCKDREKHESTLPRKKSQNVLPRECYSTCLTALFYSVERRYEVTLSSGQ